MKKRVIAQDASVTLVKYDIQLGLLDAFNKLNSEAGGGEANVQPASKVQLVVRYMASGVIKSMFEIDGSAQVLTAFQEHEQVSRKVNELLKYLEEKRSSNAVGETMQENMKLRCQTWVSNLSAKLRNHLGSITEAMLTIKNSVEGKLIDWKPALKKMDADLIGEIINAPHKSDIVNAVKI